MGRVGKKVEENTVYLERVLLASKLKGVSDRNVKDITQRETLLGAWLELGATAQGHLEPEPLVRLPALCVRAQTAWLGRTGPRPAPAVLTGACLQRWPVAARGKRGFQEGSPCSLVRTAHYV